MVFIGQRKYGWINRQESKLSNVIEIAVSMGVVNRSLQIAIKTRSMGRKGSRRWRKRTLRSLTPHSPMSASKLQLSVENLSLKLTWRLVK